MDDYGHRSMNFPRASSAMPSSGRESSAKKPRPEFSRQCSRRLLSQLSPPILSLCSHPFCIPYPHAGGRRPTPLHDDPPVFRQNTELPIPFSEIDFNREHAAPPFSNGSVLPVIVRRSCHQIRFVPHLSKRYDGDVAEGRTWFARRCS